VPRADGRYYGKLLALLARVAREGTSGTVHLAGAAGSPTASITFSRGRLVGMTLPAPDGSASPGNKEASRAAFLAGIRALGASGGEPELVPASDAMPPEAPGTAPSAADLALDLTGIIEDIPSLRAVLLRDGDRPIVRGASPPACPPGPALGPGERFVLSRADGSLNRARLVALSPAGEQATLRALYGLEALGMIVSGPAVARASAAQGAKAGDLDTFLAKTSATGRSAPAPPATRYSAEQQKEREALAELFRSSSGKDPYTVLGVTRTASESEIRAAYYALARRYHPDHMRKRHLEDLLREIEMMFASMTEAYNILGDERSRQEYDRSALEAAAGRQKEKSDPVAVARDLYLRGRREMDAGHTFEAIRLFEAATQSDPSRFEYFHFLGVCQGQNPRWRKRAEENLLKTISMNPSAPQAYVELARIYRKGGLERRALEMYGQALKWEPDNEEALEALGRSGGKDSTATGILRSIFRKD